MPYSYFISFEERFLKNDYPFTLYQRLFYPLFAILILNSEFGLRAKQDFIEKFMNQYMSDPKFRKKVQGKYIIFEHEIGINFHNKEKRYVDRFLGIFNSNYNPKTRGPINTFKISSEEIREIDTWNR